MFRLTVIATGKLKERFYQEAAAEYQKRLGALCAFELIELPEERLPENPSPAQIAAALEREAAAVTARVPRGASVFVCTPEGRELSSPELAERLAQEKLAGRSAVCFVIGSSYGLAESLKRRAEFRLSCSRMTFPHHLFRVMLLEQLYRAESIQAGSKYHK